MLCRTSWLVRACYGQCGNQTLISRVRHAQDQDGFPCAHPASLDEHEFHQQWNARCTEEVRIGGDVAKVRRAATAATVAVAVAVAMAVIMTVVMITATGLFFNSMRHVSHGRAHLCIRDAGLAV